MVEIISKRSNNKDRKFDARIHNRKTVSFGAKGYDHFTEGHLDDKRKQSYVEDMEVVIKIGKIMKRQGSGRTIFSGESPHTKKR